MHKTATSKPTSNKLREEICFTLKMQYFLQESNQGKRRLIKYFLSSDKQMIAGGDLFSGSCGFYIKNKLKTEIFNGKKVINKNVFLFHN